MLAILYGAGCYLAAGLVMLYAIGFVGNLLVPKSIDSGEAVSQAEALTVDLLLLGLFAVQHSVMARPFFKKWWSRLVPPPLERSTYVLASGAALSVLFWLWRPLPGVVWEIQEPMAAAVVWGLFAVGWVLASASTFLIDHFDLFGLRQVYLFAVGRPYAPAPLRSPILYRVIRHPIMLGFLLAFWAAPIMTWGHLLFAGTFSVYILAGIQLEERDLRRDHGHAYEAYRQQVPMLVPWPGRRA